MLLQNDQLTAKQLKDLDELVKVVLAHDHGGPAIYKHLLLEKRDAPTHFLYYLADKKIKTRSPLVGFLSLYFFYEDAIEVSLWIHPDFRHKEIDKQLLLAAMPLCLSVQKKQLVFSTSPSYCFPFLQKAHALFHHTEYHLMRTHSTPEYVATTRLKVRVATTSDIKILCELDKACFQTNDEDMEARFLYVLSNQDYLILVAELEAQHVIGKIHLRFEHSSTELSDFCISPAYQHQGLGGELLTHAIQYAHQRPCTHLTLDVEANKKNLLKLYTDHGFIVMKTTDFYHVDGYTLFNTIAALAPPKAK